MGTKVSKVKESRKLLNIIGELWKLCRASTDDHCVWNTQCTCRTKMKRNFTSSFLLIQCSRLLASANSAIHILVFSQMFLSVWTTICSHISVQLHIFVISVPSLISHILSLRFMSMCLLVPLFLFLAWSLPNSLWSLDHSCFVFPVLIYHDFICHYMYCPSISILFNVSRFAVTKTQTCNCCKF